MAELFTGTVDLEKGVDAALIAALEQADSKKPAKVGTVGYQYIVQSISGTQGGIGGNTLSVEIEADF